MVRHLLRYVVLRLQLACFDEVCEELGVVEHFELAAEARVLVSQRVEAVGAVGDDLLHLLLLEGGEGAFDLHLGQVLVAHAPRRVAGA